MFNRGGQGHEQRLDMPGNQVNHGRPAATIGHMGEAKPRILREKRAGQMADGPIALRSKCQLAIRRPRPGDEARHIPRRGGRVDHQYLRGAHGFNHRAEIPHGVKANTRVKRRVDRERV